MLEKPKNDSYPQFSIKTWKTRFKCSLFRVLLHPGWMWMTNRLFTGPFVNIGADQEFGAHGGHSWCCWPPSRAFMPANLSSGLHMGWHGPPEQGHPCPMDSSGNESMFWLSGGCGKGGGVFQTSSKFRIFPPKRFSKNCSAQGVFTHSFVKEKGPKI